MGPGPRCERRKAGDAPKTIDEGWRGVGAGLSEGCTEDTLQVVLHTSI